MSARAGVVMLLLAACGGKSTPVDAPIDEAIDAAPLGPFGARTPIAELNTQTSKEEDPSLTDDQLEIFFVSDRLGGVGLSDIWTATRTSTSAPWGTPSNIVAINTAMDELHPEVSLDGLSMYLTSNRTGTLGGLDVWFTTRASRSAPWVTPTRVTELSSTATDFSASPDSTGLVLVLGSDRAGNVDLFLSTRISTSMPWRGPTAIGGIDTAVNEQDGVLADAGRTLYFTSGAGGTGLNDLMFATRPAVDKPFGVPAPLGELNTAMNELDPWVSEDQRTIYFNSDTDGTEDLYFATR